MNVILAIHQAILTQRWPLEVPRQTYIAGDGNKRNNIMNGIEIVTNHWNYCCHISLWDHTEMLKATKGMSVLLYESLSVHTIFMTVAETWLAIIVKDITKWLICSIMHYSII